VPDSDTHQANSPSPIRRAARNFGKLLRGRTVAAVLELLTIGLLAKTLSPDQLGIIVLIQTYALIVRGLFNFKLFDVIVRFGVPLLEANEDDSFKQLLRLTLCIDFLSCAIATVIAIAAAPIAGKILGWDADQIWMTILYCSILLTFGFGTAKGVLRLFDRYDVLGIQVMVTPVLRLTGVLLVLLLHPSVWLFVVAIMLATGAGNIYLIARGWAELRRQVGTIELRGLSLKGWQEDFPGLRQFFAIVYWQSNMDMLPKYISTLLAGAILGPAGAGFLRLGREATKILSKPGALLVQVLFPDLVRMWVRGSADFRSILVRAILLCAMFGAVFIAAAVFGGSRLLTSTLGADYAQAAPLLSLLFLAATLELVTSVLRTAGYAMGHAGRILRFHLFSSALFLVLFVVLTPYTGLIGPGLAASIAVLLPLCGIGWLVIRDINKGPVPTS